MEMEKRTPQMETRRSKGRDKIEMAWRHKSRSEKNLIKVIGFLVFALLCFIVAVIAMDFAFKAKIKDLEDEIDNLQTDAPSTTFSSTEEPDYNTTTESSTTTPETSVTTTTPEPTTTMSTTLETSTSTETDTSTSSSSQTSSAITVKEETDPIFEALRSLLTNFSGMKSGTKSIDESTQRGSITSKSHGTFIFLADINHEESQSMTPSPSTRDPIDIDSSGSPSGMPQEDDVNNGTAILDIDSPFDDTEEDFEATTEDISPQGSGDGTHEHSVPP